MPFFDPGFFGGAARNSVNNPAPGPGPGPKAPGSTPIDPNNPIDRATASQGPLGWLAQGLGITQSGTAAKAAYDQIHDPNHAAYVNGAAPGALAGVQGIATNGVDFSSAQPGQNAQNDALGLSGQLARGQGPSISRANMNLGLSQGAANINSMSRGGAAAGGLGQRNALQSLAMMQGQSAGQGAVAGAAEQIGNIQNYGALGSAARGQGIQQGVADTSARLAANQSAYDMGRGQSADARDYDVALQTAGLRRADAINGYSGGLAGAAGTVLHGAGNGASSLATMIASHKSSDKE